MGQVTAAAQNPSLRPSTLCFVRRLGTTAIALKGGGAIDHDVFVRVKRSAQVAREEIVASLIGMEKKGTGP
jgi:hypothetical protein